MELLDQKIWIIVIGLILFVLLENVFPKEKIRFVKKINRTFKNIFFWVLNIGITPIIILPITIYATTFNLHQTFTIQNLFTVKWSIGIMGNDKVIWNF